MFCLNEDEIMILINGFIFRGRVMKMWCLLNCKFHNLQPMTLPAQTRMEMIIGIFIGLKCQINLLVLIYFLCKCV